MDVIDAFSQSQQAGFVMITHDFGDTYIHGIRLFQIHPVTFILYQKSNLVDLCVCFERSDTFRHKSCTTPQWKWTIGSIV